MSEESTPHATAVSMYGGGATWAEIGDVTGLSSSSIAHALRKAGIVLDRHGDKSRVAQDSYLAHLASPDTPEPSGQVTARILAIVWELQRECGRLEAERDSAREVAVMFHERLTHAIQSTGGDASSVPHLPTSWTDPRGA